MSQKYSSLFDSNSLLQNKIYCFQNIKNEQSFKIHGEKIFTLKNSRVFLIIRYVFILVLIIQNQFENSLQIFLK